MVLFAKVVLLAECGNPFDVAFYIPQTWYKVFFAFAYVKNGSGYKKVRLPALLHTVSRAMRFYADDSSPAVMRSVILIFPYCLAYVIKQVVGGFKSY